MKDVTQDVIGVLTRENQLLQKDVRDIARGVNALHIAHNSAVDNIEDLLAENRKLAQVIQQNATIISALSDLITERGILDEGELDHRIHSYSAMVAEQMEEELAESKRRLAQRREEFMKKRASSRLTKTYESGLGGEVKGGATSSEENKASHIII